jgi:hypothetical protein
MRESWFAGLRERIGIYRFWRDVRGAKARVRRQIRALWAKRRGGDDSDDPRLTAPRDAARDLGRAASEVAVKRPICLLTGSSTSPLMT